MVRRLGEMVGANGLGGYKNRYRKIECWRRHFGRSGLAEKGTNEDQGVCSGVKGA